jgi:6,7-dimethyl-8-ribityllumazine synthase
MRDVGLVAGDFNKQIVDVMIDTVVKQAAGRAARITPTVRLPGCYEVPLVADAVLAGPCHGLVVIGYIERGETLHGEVMGHVVHRALVELGLKYKKPVGIGIIGPGATLEQARARAADYAAAALAACLASLDALDGLARLPDSHGM